VGIMGLVIFGAIALYLIVTLVIVVLAAKVAKKQGRSPWRWGGVNKWKQMGTDPIERGNASKS
jgi:hypothetical protein